MDYQQKVIKAFETLEQVKIELFTSLINVAMAMEFKEVHEVLDNEEIFSFRESDFENAEDPNVEILLYLVKQMTIAQEEMTIWNGKNFLKSPEKQ